MKFAFDRSLKKGLFLQNGELHLSGWCFGRNGEPPSEVSVCVDGFVYVADLCDRADIAGIFSKIRFESERLGFAVNLTGLRPGRFTLEVRACFGDSSPEVLFSKKIRLKSAFFGSKVAPRGPHARFHIDEPSLKKKVHFRAGHFQMSGWFVDQNGRPAKQIVGRIGKRMIIADRSPRPDVNKALGLSDLDENLGFLAFFKTGPGPKLLKIEAHTEDGEIVTLGQQLLFNTVLGAKKSSYELWIRHRDTFYSLDKKSDQAMLNALGINPKFSIILPTYNTEPKLLRQTIRSVLDQMYENWELCIVDDASSDQSTSAELKKIEAFSEKIKVTYRKENGHISVASNDGLAMATGDWVCLLDHDDLVSPRALMRIAVELEKRPELKFIYTDEDKIDAQGQRFGPYFKPDWNPDLFHGNNYICHFVAAERALVEEVGGFRKGFEGAQDYDLFLRLTAKLQESQIHHIPEVLYSWRATPGSTAVTASAKSYTHDAGLRALEERFAGQSYDVQNGIVPNSYRIVHPLPDTMPRVSIIIPMRDKVHYTQRCIASIFEKSTYKNFEIIIVDNNSVETETFDYFEELDVHPKVSVLKFDGEFNYSKINNFAASEANGEILVLLNNDIEVITTDWLEELVRHAVRPEIGCVGAKLYYPDDTIQHAGVIIGMGGVAGHWQKDEGRGEFGYHARLVLTQNYSAVTAACLAVRKSVFESVGGLEENLAVAFNDVDFCLRVLDTGLRNLWTPYVEMYHHESKSRGTENTLNKAARFKKEIEFMDERYGDFEDPAYNPSLYLGNEHLGYRLKLD